MNPQGSGSSACVSQAVPEDLKAAVELLIKTTKWRGLFMVELLRDHAGNSWFAEFNGRPWGSIALSRRQGFEYAAWHAGLAVNEHSSVGMTMSGAPGVVCRECGPRAHAHPLRVARREVESADRMAVILEGFK